MPIEDKVEKLLNDLGFTNGILKVNINFVKNRVGTENELTRVWIQEISPSREEIRIVPLKTNDSIINNITKTQFTNLKSLVKEFAKDFAGNIHKIVASCVTPKKKFACFYFDSKKDHEDIAEDMLHAPITEVLGYCVFFCNSLPKLISTTMDYLLENSPKEAKEKMQAIVDLWQGLDGYSMLNQFPNMKESN